MPSMRRRAPSGYPFGPASPRGLRVLALIASAGGWGLVGCEETTLVAREPLLQLTPALVDFGTVEITQQAVERLSLGNREIVAAQIGSLEVVDDCGGCFVVLERPRRLSANETVELPVRFRAVRLEVATATLTVTEQSSGRAVSARLVGRGSDTRRPDIAVTPAAVDFGLVPAGGIALRTFVVRSVGSLDLLIDRLTLDPPTAPFRITTSTPTPEMPGRLPPGSSASVSLRAELPATDTATRTARILIETNVLETKNVPGRPGVVAVPLTALGNLPPVAVPGDDLTVDPFAQVELDGSRSYDQDDPPDLPLTFRWTLVARPGGSRAEFVRANTARPILRPDLAGRYELELVVRDGLGLESEPARLVVEALPDEAVRIELIWDHPDSDLDLHLIREDGAFCQCGGAVFFQNCGQAPEWFPANPGANPRLDLDDRNGFGPENINIDGDGVGKFVPPGTYRIAVHYYASNAATSSWPTSESVATVRVFTYGLLTAEVTRTMVADRELWMVGALRWPERTFVPDGSVMPGAVCGGVGRN